MDSLILGRYFWGNFHGARDCQVKWIFLRKMNIFRNRHDSNEILHPLVVGIARFLTNYVVPASGGWDSTIWPLVFRDFEHVLQRLGLARFLLGAACPGFRAYL